jgi:hypothetical protein
MKRGMLLFMTVVLLAGYSQSSMAQAAKPAAQKKKTAKTAEPTVASAPVETAAVVEPIADSTPPVDSITPEAPHHKKGLFGKAKGVMSNKVVKTIAKTAACTMIPGGQAIAGAIDAASSKSAGEAAAGAAGAASGTSCMPGMGGGGALAGAGMANAGMAGRGGLAGLAGAGLANAAAQSAYSRSANAQANAGTGYQMPGGMGLVADPKPMADCMGLTVDEYNALINPTNGEARPVTKAEMKRMQHVSKKVDPQRQIACSQSIGMQQANAQGAQMQQMMAQAQGNTAARTAASDGNGATVHEAAGQNVELASDLAADLKKGKTVVKGIDWIAGSAEISPAGRATFDGAMTKLGQAMKESGQHYRLDLYMDQRYDDAAVSTFGPARLQVVQSALAAALGDPSAGPQIGKTKRDKNPRLELVKTK